MRPVQIKFSNSPPLILQATNPRILYFLGFLVSSTAKRDAVGRKPKRTAFATQGLAVLVKEEAKGISRKPCCVPLFLRQRHSRVIVRHGASLQDVRDFQETVAKIKADLLCESIGVCSNSKSTNNLRLDVFCPGLNFAQ